MTLPTLADRRERARQLLYLTTPSLWSVYPFLPLTRPGPGLPECGMLFDAKETCGLFGFSANEPAAFHCRLDQRRFVLCEPPKAYRNLKPGRHRFEVFAVDAAGNRDLTPAVSRFWIPKSKPRKPKD